jgi:hypothetical protein
MNFQIANVGWVALVLQENNMKEILTDKQRYDIINSWSNYGPTTYYNLVRQTEMFIIEKQENNTKSHWYTRILNVFNKKKD